MHKLIFVFGLCLMFDSAFSQPIFVNHKPPSFLKFDGYYSNSSANRVIRNEWYYWPVFFFKNNTVLLFTVGFSDQGLQNTLEKPSKHLYTKYSAGLERANWGFYEISGDTVKARIYVSYMNTGIPRWKLRLTHYIGIINDTAIIDWHAVPPYPKKIMDFDEESFGRSSNLIFQKSEFPNLIDPSKAWINKK